MPLLSKKPLWPRFRDFSPTCVSSPSSKNVRSFRRFVRKLRERANYPTHHSANSKRTNPTHGSHWNHRRRFLRHRFHRRYFIDLRSVRQRLCPTTVFIDNDIRQLHITTDVASVFRSAMVFIGISNRVIIIFIVSENSWLKKNVSTMMVLLLHKLYYQLEMK